MANVNIDWFVAADGGAQGDGSRTNPFHDPWLAFRHAAPGDTVHIAAGMFWGRFDRSSWIIDCPNLTVLGGYSRDFATRTPWKTPSILGCYPGYEYVRENSLITGRDNHSGLNLDGLCFDAADRNVYGNQTGESIRWYSDMEGPIASFNADGVVIRNCIFANSANGGVELSGSGSRFENNLLLNMIGLAMLDLRSSNQMIQRPIAVTANTFCFMHDTSDPAGKGGDRSHGIRVNCPAVIESNVFVSCGNSAISTMLAPARISIEHNLFFVTPHVLVESRALDSPGEIKENNLDELEDLAFKSCTGNVVQDPSIKGLPSTWFDAYSRHMFSRYATPPRAALNALREATGLPAVTPADVEKPDQQGALAPRFAVANALGLSFGAPQGFHAAEISVAIAPPPEAAKPAYRRIEWSSFEAPDPSLADTPVELRAGLGAEQNINLLADAGPDSHMGVRIYQPGSDDNSIYVLIRRNTLPARQFREGVNYNRGVEVENTYYLQGIFRTDIASSRQKATLIVDSIVPAPLFSPAPPVRPVGRDWFVRAGSSGGDGSRDKPFRDPFQALEKAEGGDSIHIAAGDYFGKLHSGRWNVSIRNLAFIGGYDAEFAARDPWSNLTRFVFDQEQKTKGRPEGTILYSQENCDGLIVDGFIFDGATWNTYKDGALDLDTSPLAPLVELRGLSSPVAVRNCLFLNASDGAIILDCPLAVFENNIVVNTSGDALVIRANGAGPAAIRNNTILFACDPTDRAGTGKSSSGGTLLQLTGRAAITLDSNIFGFADNFGVRTAVPQQNVTLRSNQFAANLFNHVSDANYLWADSSNWTRRVEADSAFILETNQLQVASIPVDAGFADAVLPRLFSLPSRISHAEWKAIAASIGSSARPVEEEAPTAAPPPKPVGGTSGSPLDNLLAKLKSTEAKAQEATAKPPSKPLYCPIFDYKKALTLAGDVAGSGRGAHRRKLTVSFTPDQQSMPAIEYTRIGVADLDARELLNNKAIEISVTQLRESSTNPSLFPAGTDRKDFAAYSVDVVDGETRTRLAIVVKDDTLVSNVARRSVPTDKFVVRGTAHVTGSTNGLSVVVDAIELT